jgi:transcriptional regulator with PAS, ATPase and Fis domain
MQDVYELIIKAASSGRETLICGESGTGKELIAHTIHRLSSRQELEFVPVNCGAVPETVFEREFFGHRKGAFTGADRTSQGYFEAAHGGTLFLDEVGELTPTMQVKLLRAIESGEYTPLGATQSSTVDARIIAATNRNLPELVENKTMREDFFYRIHVIVITLPPLRQRKEDIPLLVEHFMRQHMPDVEPAPLPGHVLEALYQYDWPGNIRQLRNVLTRYLTVGLLDFTGPRSLEKMEQRVSIDSGLSFPQASSLRELTEQFEKQAILQALQQHRWHRANTAKTLQIGERTLYRKMKQYRLV